MVNKVNINDIAWQQSEDNHFSAVRKPLAREAGGEMLGCSLYKLQPGDKAFPFHCHHANEEAIFVLSGKGTLRLSDQQLPIVKDDYIALPKGSKNAHQVINTSADELVYLCFSTMIQPDVMEYPDSGKLGFMTGSPPGGIKNEQSLKAFFFRNDAVDYFAGEE